MNQGILYSLITLIIWGFWGVFGKLASRTLTAREMIPYIVIGNFVALLLLLPLLKGRISTLNFGKPELFAIISSIAYLIGGVFFWISLTKGNVVQVVLISAMYPVITIGYSLLFLGEEMTLRHGLGIVISMVGILMISL